MFAIIGSLLLNFFSAGIWDADVSQRTLCENSPEMGHCSARLTRYYYDPRTMSCNTFIYSGCGGNGNNFEAEEQCYETCKAMDSTDPCHQEKEIGPCHQQIPRYYYNQNAKQCELFYYGGCQGNSNRFQTKDLCEKTCTISGKQASHLSTNAVCQKPRDRGPCTSFVPRFFFSSRSGRCEYFLFGGCEGNENNFVTAKECEATCMRDFCKMDVDRGPCGEMVVRYYYDKKTRSCEMFFYGGCQGNGNRFGTDKECQLACMRTTSTQCETMRNGIFDDCGSACPLTCENYLNPPAACLDVCVPGCVCLPGFVKNSNGRCIQPHEC